MKHFFFALALVSVIFLAGCAEDLTPVENDRPPAPYSPDPESHIPQSVDTYSPRI